MTESGRDQRVSEILQRPYHRVIKGEPIEGYLGEVLELPGCLTAGETPEEALRNLDEAMAVLDRVGACPWRPDSRASHGAGTAERLSKEKSLCAR